MLCQHPTPKSDCLGHGRFERLWAGENVFDPHDCPSGIGDGARQVYVYRIEKAARITMVKVIIEPPCFGLEKIFVPDSYVDLMIFYVCFFSNG